MTWRLGSDLCLKWSSRVSARHKNRLPATRCCEDFYQTWKPLVTQNRISPLCMLPGDPWDSDAEVKVKVERPMSLKRELPTYVRKPHKTINAAEQVSAYVEHLAFQRMRARSMSHKVAVTDPCTLRMSGNSHGLFKLQYFFLL